MLLASAGPFLWLEELGDGLIRQDQLALINAMARAISTPTTKLMQQQFDWPVAGNSALSGCRLRKAGLTRAYSTNGAGSRCETSHSHGRLSLLT